MATVALVAPFALQPPAAADGARVTGCPLPLPPLTHTTLTSQHAHNTHVLQPHSQSARELRRMVLESLDALFGFNIPLPAEAVAAHLEAMEGVFARCLRGMRTCSYRCRASVLN